MVNHISQNFTNKKNATLIQSAAHFVIRTVYVGLI